MSAKIPPKPTKDVIYIDVDDEITGIIDKVENSSHKVVALVLPKRAASLQSIVNMKLLKRSADGADKNVVLITSEHALIPLAGAAGLHVARSLQSTPEIPDAPAASAPAKASAEPAAEDVPGDEADEEDVPKKYDYARPIGALAAKHEADNPETIDLDDEEEKPAAAAAVAAAAKKKPKGDKVKIPNFDRFRMLIGLGILALAGLIIFIILALFVLPKATITIHTSSEPVSTSFNLNASPGAKVNPAAGTIPSKLESSDLTGTQSVTATGQKNNGNTASGSITMTAQECAPHLGNTPNDVPAGTGVSSGGQNYITQDNASFSFSGGSGSCINYTSNSVDITAQAAGSKYNVDNASFSVTGRSDVSGTGSASGGTDDIVTVLSQSDVDGAKDKLTSSSNGTTFVKSFEDKLASQDEYVLTNTLKAGNPQITSTPTVGQPASTATVNIKITYTVIALQKSDLKKIIEAKLSGQIDKTKQKLNGNFLGDSTINVASQDAKGDASLAVNVDTTAVPIINEESVKNVARGHKTGDIQSAIGNWAGVKSVDVKLSPFWVSKVPGKDSKITVVFQEDKSTNGNQNNSAP